MDVHPPHEPIHSWRDFLLHLLTITIGLLIALGLEAAVENLHHRNIVREAREKIRHELEQNQQAVASDLKGIDTNKHNLQNDMERLRAIRKNPAAEKGSRLTYEFDWSSFNESAWFSARDSGALTYMPTDEVQRYADVYNQQEVATNEAVSIFSAEVQIAAPFMMEGDDPLSRDEVQGMMHDTAVTYSRLYALRQIVEQLGQIYADALKK